MIKKIVELLYHLFKFDLLLVKFFFKGGCLHMFGLLSKLIQFQPLKQSLIETFKLS